MQGGLPPTCQWFGYSRVPVGCSIVTLLGGLTPLGIVWVSHGFMHLCVCELVNQYDCHMFHVC